MQITGILKRSALTVGVTAAAALAGGAPAQASDAGLRKVVVQQEQRLAPVAEEFTEAVKTPTSAVGIERLSAALKDLRAQTSSYRKAVTKVRTETTRVRRGRADLVVALGRVSAALTIYGDGLQLVLDEKAGQAKTTFTRAAAALKAANVRVDRATAAIRAKG